MMTVTVRAEWDMGHRLPNHAGACSNLHGHRYVAEISVRGPVRDTQGAPDEGMVADFTNIKAAVKEVVAQVDHRFMLQHTDPCLAAMTALPGVFVTAFVPTAENIAIWLLRELRRTSQMFVGVRLYETPTAYVVATWPDIDDSQGYRL